MVPPEFPTVRTLKSYNGHTRTSLLDFRKSAPERPFAAVLRILTNHALSKKTKLQNLSIKALHIDKKITHFHRSVNIFIPRSPTQITLTELYESHIIMKNHNVSDIYETFSCCALL